MTETSTAAGSARTPGGRGRDYVPLIRERLRAEILDGRLPPRSQISQAQVAAELGISRGPVR